MAERHRRHWDQQQAKQPYSITLHGCWVSRKDKLSNEVEDSLSIRNCNGAKGRRREGTGKRL